MTQRSSTTAQILESDSAPSSRPVPVPGPLPRKKPKTGLNNKIRPQTAALPTQDEIDRDIIERMATDVPGWESGTDDGHEVYPQDDGNGRLPAVDSRLDGPVVRDPAREDPLQKAELLENSDLDNLTSDFRLAEYILTVDQAKVLLESFYVHLPFKRALHGVDPIQKLNILRRRLEDPSSPEFPTPLEFHHEMTRIFASVCDRHTMYLLPSPLREKVAFLGIKVEDTFDQAGQRRYLVTHAIPKVLETLKDLAEGDKDSFFEVLDPTGEDNEEEKKRKVVEVVSWNGVPIRRAVEINAENHAGSNLEARHARGLTRLTLRPLKVSLPPDERWATIGYRIFEKEGKEFILRDSEIKELTLPWRILDQLPEVVGDDPRQAATRGIDAEGDAVHQLSKLLFAKDGESGPNDRSPASQAFKSELGNEIGYLRIFTFNVDPCDFVKEFSRLLKQASQDAPKGLILDVRGNSGGSIWAAERILQFLTPRRIEPARFQVRNTPAIRELCRLHSPSSLYPGFDLSPWLQSLEQDAHTGAEYSRSFPITSVESCNAIGQRYYGPVVLITDALSYSATDIFAAGFRDHDVGLIIGIDGRTGGGGANLFEHELLWCLACEPDPPLNDSPLKALTRNLSMNVAMRRALRVGERAGMPLENFGVDCDHPYRLTCRDLLHGNQDLINFAAGILEDNRDQRPTRRLDADVRRKGDSLEVFDIRTQGIDRLDIYVDECPETSIILTNKDEEPTESITVTPKSNEPSVLELRGYKLDPMCRKRTKKVDRFLPGAREDRLVARRKIWIWERVQEAPISIV